MWTDNYNVGYAIHNVEERHLEKPDKNRLKDALPKSVLEKVYNHILACGYNHTEYDNSTARPTRIRIEEIEKDRECKDWIVRVVVDYEYWDEDTEDDNPLVTTKGFVFRIGY